MIFTRRFFILFAVGVLPLVFVWGSPGVKWGLVAYDLVLLLLAYVDYRRVEDTRIEIVRRMPAPVHDRRRERSPDHDQPPTSTPVHADDQRRISAGAGVAGERTLVAAPLRRGTSDRQATVEYKLYAASRGDYGFGDIVVRRRGPWGLIIKQDRVKAEEDVKVYPNINEARRHELSARRNRQMLIGARKTRVRGQGREFESMRDYVRGDEMRHISWTATARRGRLITKQYQIERNQSIIAMIDAGRLMTSRIEHLSKLDHAINAALAIGYVATRGGDNVGLLVFNRQVTAYLPPQRGHAQLAAMTEALYNVKAQMIEPSTRARSNTCRKIASGARWS